MSALEEKVARAMCTAVGMDPDYDDYGPEDMPPWNRFRHQAAAAIAIVLAEMGTPCVWTGDNDGGWDSGCGQSYIMECGEPPPFCCQCGHPTQVERL